MTRLDNMDEADRHAELAEDAAGSGISPEAAGIIHAILALRYTAAELVSQLRDGAIDAGNELHTIKEDVAAIREVTSSLEESVDELT